MIAFWTRIVKLRKKGVDTSQTKLRRLSRKLRVYSAFYADVPSVVLQLKLACRSYRDAKLQAPDWRDKQQNKTSTQIKARMKREQHQRDLGWLQEQFGELPPKMPF